MLWMVIVPAYFVAIDQGPIPDSPRRALWQVNVAAAVATPAVLPDGIAYGANIEAQRHAAFLPLFISLRLLWADATAANDAWIFDHQQIVGAAAIGSDITIGAGRLWIQGGAGATAVYERLSRHQKERIQDANVPGGVETNVTVGPYAFAELGVSVKMRGGVGSFFAVGPSLSESMVAGSAHWRFGGFARLGVLYDF